VLRKSWRFQDLQQKQPTPLGTTLVHHNNFILKSNLTIMKIILIVCFLSTSILTFGQTDNGITIYYKSGKIQMERKFDNTCNCDKVTEYFESGKIRSISKYLHIGSFNTQLDGENIYYFENGIIQMYTFYKDGSPTGRSYNNLVDGKLAHEKFYANKFKTGTWKFYNFDGTLSEEVIYLNNKTLWNSNDDYSTNKFYFENKLAYTVEFVAGKKTNIKVIDKESYEMLIAKVTGQTLFTENCGMCHSSNFDIVGPKLKGVTDQRTNEWLIKMITNGDSLVKIGDKDAVTLYQKWGNMPHPNFERLENEEVVKIIDYLKTLK
jgi:antitoxin component YwqK of YwqJK toxin-antitoxin module